MAKPVIFIRRKTNGTVQYIYRIENFDNFSVRFRSPIIPMPLPEENDDRNILVKTEGNSTTITVNWVINATAINRGTNHNGASAPGNTKTIFEQLIFWQDFMIGNSITSGFDIVLGDDLTSELDEDVPTGINYQKRGFSTNFDATTQGSEPNSFRGIFTMIVGDVITGYNTNTPSEPLNFKLVEGTLSGEIDITWDTPDDAGTTAISGYIIRTKTGTEQWDQTSFGVVTSATITGLTAGSTYQVQMYAQNNSGNGDGRLSRLGEVVAKV